MIDHRSLDCSDHLDLFIIKLGELLFGNLGMFILFRSTIPALFAYEYSGIRFCRIKSSVKFCLVCFLKVEKSVSSFILHSERTKMFKSSLLILFRGHLVENVVPLAYSVTFIEKYFSFALILRTILCNPEGHFPSPGT